MVFSDTDITCVHEYVRKLSQEGTSTPFCLDLTAGGDGDLRAESLQKIGSLLHTSSLTKYILIADTTGMASVIVFSTLEDALVATAAESRRNSGFPSNSRKEAQSTTDRKDLDELFAKSWTRGSILKRLSFCRSGNPDLVGILQILEAAKTLQKASHCHCQLVIQSEVDDVTRSVLGGILKNATTLDSINITGSDSNALAKYLLATLQSPDSSTALSLRKLDLSWCGLENEDIEQFADFLKSDCNLETLRLYGNQIDDKGMQFIAVALRSNKSLRTLGLEDRQLVSKQQQHRPPHRRRRVGCETNGLLAFLETLRSFNTTLQRIDLCPQNVDDYKGTISAVKDCLEHNIGLTRFDLAIEFRSCPGVHYSLKNLVAKSARKSLTENRQLMAKPAVMELSNERLFPHILAKTKRPIMTHHLMNERMDFVVQALVLAQQQRQHSL